jgi:hypothetical protein
MIYPDDYLNQFCLSLGLDPENSADSSQVSFLMTSALLIADNYCHRHFNYEASCSEKFIINASKTVQLKRFPVTGVESITYVSGVEIADYLLDEITGIVIFSQEAVETQIEITYSGGFDPIPADVLLALQSAVRKLYSSSQGDSGQSIRKMQAPDVGLIEYFDNSSFQTASGMPVRFGEMFNLLEPYRVYSA